MSIEFESNTKEWHEQRQKSIGSSDAPVIAGLSPWKNIYQLFDEKMGLTKPQKMNYAMQIGINNEPIARDIFEFKYGVKVPAKRVVHKKYPFLSANLDGYNEENNYLVEIKVPGKSTIQMAKEKKVPDHYYIQIQHQLMVSEASFAYYVVYDQKATIYEVQICHDLVIQKNLLRLSKWFWNCVENNKRPKDGYNIKLKI